MSEKHNPPNAVPATLKWLGSVEGQLRIIDQTRLPVELVEIDLETVPQVHEAIRSLRVRGAPAIGVAAAYGVVLGARNAIAQDLTAFLQTLNQTIEHLATSRPTAVNLFWALDRMKACAGESPEALTEGNDGQVAGRSPSD